MREIDPSNLKQATVRGVSWKILAEVVTQGTRLVLLIVLARLLVPEDFGLAAIVLAFLVFVPVLADFALGASLVYKPTLDEDDRSTVFWTTIPLGIFFTALGVGLSWPLAAFFDDPRLQPLFSAFSALFLIAALASTPAALLRRAMAFRALELRVMAGTLAGAACAIALALAGFGPWALVGGELANRTLALVLIWAQCDWRPQLRFSTTRLRELAGYSSALLGAHLFLQLSTTLQNLAVGRLLGARALGTLTVSQTIVLLPFNRIATPIQEVLFPAFSRIQDDPDRIRDGWIRVNQVVAAVAFPALIGLAILADEFTQVVLGAKWADAPPIIRILAVSGMALALQGFNFSILQALAYTRSLLWVSAVASASAVVAVVIGSQWGLTGAAVAITIQSIVIQGIFMTITARAVSTTLFAVLRTLGGVTRATAIMGIAVYGSLRLLSSIDASATVVLIGCSIAGAAVYATVFSMTERALLGEIRALVRSGRGSGG